MPIQKPDERVTQIAHFFPNPSTLFIGAMGGPGVLSMELLHKTWWGVDNTSLIWQANFPESLSPEEKELISRYLGQALGSAWATIRPGEKRTFFLHSYDLHVYLGPSSN